MLEIAALTYGVLASFVVSSAARNKREARRNPPMLLLLGWLMVAFSLSLGLILLGYVGYEQLSGAGA